MIHSWIQESNQTYSWRLASTFVVAFESVGSLAYKICICKCLLPSSKINKMKAMTSCLLALVAYLSILAGAYSLDDTVVPLDDTTLRHYIVFKATTGDMTVNDESSPTSVETEMTQMVNLARSSVDTFATFDVAEQPPVEFSYVFKYALRGCALKLTEATAATLSTFPGVSVILDGTSEPHTTHTPEFLGLTTGQLWPKSKNGRDVIVGVIDTGIWPESPSFDDTGMGPIPSKWKGICQEGTRFTLANCNKKLIGARFYYKGHQAAEGVDLTTQILSARDTNGHGTHTSSTAAGSPVKDASLNGFGLGQLARGMAFEGRLAMYKVCWRTCYDSDTLAAFDQAVKDGVDVISVSLGGSPKKYEDEVTTVASFGAMKAGIFVALSAGNDGGSRSTVTNIAPWAMTVGASSVDRDFYVSVLLGNGAGLRGVSWTPGAKVARPLVLASKVAAKGADPLKASNCMQGTLSPALVKGKMVVCRNDGQNNPVDKGVAVLAAGGLGVIILDNAEGPSPDYHVLPTVHVGKAAGDTILAYMKSTTTPTATLSPTTALGIKPAPGMAWFSSRGPSIMHPQILKPDITAPGLYILAGWQGNSSPTELASDPNRIKFNIISGTSMATPHISGLAALLRGAYPTWSPAMIKSALMTTASVNDNRTPKQLLIDQATSRAATPFDYGAGHVTPELALNPGLVYDLAPSDYINYLCALGYPPSKVQRFTGAPVTCLPSRVEDFNYPTFTSTFKKGSIKQYAVTFTRTLTNVGAPQATYKVLVKAPTGAKVVVNPTQLIFTPVMKSWKFSVTVTMAKPMEAFGSLTWTDGKINVRSPIVITAV
ncbi:hypothetical protein KC19_3G095500 [Ceratodon purpureus]|uniref:Subtilisin-like protease n=2 Tax=Ceratodon purpureus TaxID=3225 RepID=A0A8T0IIT4_CERPU|nr:hypothetical protein KC19_3G095500 [Ceratodon purpureus]